MHVRVVFSRRLSLKSVSERWSLRRHSDAETFIEVELSAWLLHLRTARLLLSLAALEQRLFSAASDCCLLVKPLTTYALNYKEAEAEG